MNILIIEDEARIARRIERMVSNILGNEINCISVCHDLTEGRAYIKLHPIDLLFLDLNLNGEDGFEVLKSVVAESFQTIIISAYKDRAIKAFEYGVLDFVPKPFTEDRLVLACKRVTEILNADPSAKYLAISKKDIKKLIKIANIKYIQGAGVYTEIMEMNGNKSLHNKSLDNLLRIMPSHFERIHKSYIANMNEAIGTRAEPGSKYFLILKDEEELPIGRTRYKEIKERWMT